LPYFHYKPLFSEVYRLQLDHRKKLLSKWWHARSFLGSMFFTLKISSDMYSAISAGVKNENIFSAAIWYRY